MVTALNTVSINRGVPQGTVLDLFSIFIIIFFLNVIKTVNTNKNLLVKFADYITINLQLPI